MTYESSLLYDVDGGGAVTFPLQVLKDDDSRDLNEPRQRSEVLRTKMVSMIKV